MIEFRDVTKNYTLGKNSRVVLDRQSFVIPEKQNIGLLGRNGAGKSTFLRLLAGVEWPSSGEVFRDTPVSWPVGFSGAFSMNLSADENVRFIARVYGASPNRVSAFCYEFCELGEYWLQPMKTFSTGMKARVSFAASMAIDFSVYLIDEVTAVGDKVFQEKSKKMLRNRLSSAQVIMVSHNPATLKDFCQSAAILKDGQITFFESLAEAQALYK